MFSRWSQTAVWAVAVFLVAQTYRGRALEHYKKRQFTAAAAQLEEHLKVNPADLESRLLLGLCYQQSGEARRAAIVFQECIRRAPEQPQPLFYLSRVRYEQGNLEEAEDLARKAEAKGYSASHAALLLGLIHVEQFRFNEALADFVRAQRSAGDSESEPWLQEGKLLLKLGRYSAAIQALETAVRRGGASAEARMRLDRARELEGRAQPAGDGVPRPREEPFVNVTAHSGIEFTLENHPSPNKYLVETMPGGIAAFDYDADGRLDLYFVNGAPLPKLMKQSTRDWNRLYRNLGEFQFQDVTAAAGVAGAGYGMGAAAGDYDGDGRPDIFIAAVGNNQLFRNRGGGRFEEVTERAGIHRDRWSVAASWLDFDRDGRLDLFVVNYVDWSPSREPFCGDKAKNFRVYCHPKHYAPAGNRLYRNRGDGTFADVTASSGIGLHRGKGMSAGIADYDGDGWPDIFVTNDAMPNFLFRNRQDGTFEESAIAAGVALPDDGVAVSGMGIEFRDADNDARPDVIFTALTGETFPFFRNTGSGRFRDWTYPSGLGMSSVRHAGWGIAVADFNNDGWRDIATANAHVTDNIEQFAAHRFHQPNTLFLNSSGRFPAAAEFGTPAAHRGLIAADLDGDGRLDLVTTALGSKPEIWQNRLGAGNRWIAFDLPPGSHVKLGNQSEWVSSSAGYASSVLAPVHFGLGARQIVPLVEIKWPQGRAVRIENVPAGRMVRPSALGF